MARAMRRSLKTPLPDDVSKIIAACWNRRTSYDPTGWSTTNPAWGQCAVTALVVQDLFGGVVLRGFVNGIEHYWNRLPNESEVDLTRAQFPEKCEVAAVVPVSREFILASPSTSGRYQDLRRRVLKRAPNTQPQVVAASKP
jgi:hypothetical protein